MSDPTLGAEQLHVDKKKSVHSILVEEKVIEGTDSHVKNILVSNNQGGKAKGDVEKSICTN